MRIGRILRVACLSLLCLPGGPDLGGAPWVRAAGAAEAPHHPSERERIAALLDVMERSGARFIREGTEYSGAEGRKHLERKLWYAGQRVRTAEEFIEGVASRSSTTGRPYRVRLPDGEAVDAGPWLRQKLAEVDAPQ